MYKFNFKDRVEINSTKDLSEGLFIWIWQAHKLPPHLGISQNGKYYSLLYDRKQVALSIESQMEIIRRKKLSMIWQEITSESKDLSDIFTNYTSCASDNSSCIQPILDGLEIKKKGGVLFDLLSDLSNHDTLGKALCLNLPYDFKGIKKYNRREVEMYLFKLLG
jgi:hypothetical protein|tara:strand:- start:9073 stop:9564 length:492 start_codon:yes stop_codon:yes gene_type:complete